MMRDRRVQRGDDPYLLQVERRTRQMNREQGRRTMQAKAQAEEACQIMRDAEALVSVLRSEVNASQDVLADMVRSVIKMEEATITALSAAVQRIAALEKSLAERPSLKSIGTVTVRYGGVLAASLAARKFSATLRGVRAGEILIAQSNGPMPAGFMMGQVTAIANDTIEFVMLTPALSVLVTTDIPMTIYAMRAG